MARHILVGLSQLIESLPDPLSRTPWAQALSWHPQLSPSHPSVPLGCTDFNKLLTGTSEPWGLSTARSCLKDLESLPTLALKPRCQRPAAAQPLSASPSGLSPDRLPATFWQHREEANLKACLGDGLPAHPLLQRLQHGGNRLARIRPGLQAGATTTIVGLASN